MHAVHSTNCILVVALVTRITRPLPVIGCTSYWQPPDLLSPGCIGAMARYRGISAQPLCEPCSGGTGGQHVLRVGGAALRSRELSRPSCAGEGKYMLPNEEYIALTSGGPTGTDALTPTSELTASREAQNRNTKSQSFSSQGTDRDRNYPSCRATQHRK
jgi:hypothetical protein